MTQVLDGYERHGLPLHVIVMDMEWHEMFVPPACDKFAGKQEVRANAERTHLSSTALQSNQFSDFGAQLWMCRGASLQWTISKRGRQTCHEDARSLPSVDACFDALVQWGGYSWNRTLFNDPAAFVAKCHASRGPMGIKASLPVPPGETTLCTKERRSH